MGEAGSLQYLALSYVPGPSLQKRIATGPLPIHEVVGIVGDVGSALDALHVRGIVHRDVKPSNILLGENWSAALTDYGLAKSRDDSLISVAGQVMGTLDYLAPEIIRGQPATPAVTSTRSGVSSSNASPALRHSEAGAGSQCASPTCRRSHQIPVQHAPTAPPSCPWAVLPALAKDPVERPSTAAAYLTLLQTISGH